jgi:PHD/YefM family antitoxin component YafN of YafNO toxin-antitoxin module
MSGIQFVIDDKGSKSAVIIDLNKYANIWEDFYDSLLAHQRRKEPRESLNSVKKRLHRAGKLND